jgi:hypothetical protein
MLKHGVLLSNERRYWNADGYMSLLRQVGYGFGKPWVWLLHLQRQALLSNACQTIEQTV